MLSKLLDIVPVQYMCVLNYVELHFSFVSTDEIKLLLVYER